MKEDLLPLLLKYDVPVPRYTSYPTVPFWNFETLGTERWKLEVNKAFRTENGEVCVYIHLPFCEELCTYCACNKRITKNHAVETPYLEVVLKEWEMYKALSDVPITIREIHLGGGTPTFFSPEHLQTLIRGIIEGCTVAEGHEFSVEVHPNYTTRQHLEALREVGFNRISLGVQDFDPLVQFIINRIQTFEQTKAVIDWARELGYFSVNLDLIYGLPHQTQQSIELTFQRVQELKPDRIAFYSYAHVPWKSKGQRRYSDEDVPKAREKNAMYQLGNQLLEKMGFVSIGMDHFALPTDKLLIAFQQGAMHRNFMGYTTTNHKLVIGLGASSISDTWTAFAQNEKTVEAYQEKVLAGNLPLINGHLLDGQDLVTRRQILDLMCKDQVSLRLDDMEPEFREHIEDKLVGLQADGLITVEGNVVKVLPKGKIFIRNISAVLDTHLFKSIQQSNLFSRAI